MDQQVNERWLQFAFINSKGNVNLTAIKIPFHIELKIDQEVPIAIADHIYAFTCVDKRTPSNHDGTVDEIYVVATNHQ